MEYEPNLAAAEATAQQDINLRQRFLNHPATRRVTAAVAALGLLTGGGEMAMNAEPVAADSSPAAANFKQQCIDKAKIIPKPEYAYMLNPGKKPYENNPHTLGAVQSDHAREQYPAIVVDGQSGVCDPFVVRVEHGKIQKKVGKKWRKTGDAAFRHVGNEENYQIIEHFDSVENEVDWLFWHRGDHFRLLLQNVVKNPQTKKTLDVNTKTIPLQIRHGRSQ